MDTRNLLLVPSLCLFGLAGCTDNVGPDFNDASTVYEMTLQFNELIVENDCDQDIETGLVTVPDPGEFSYFIGYRLDREGEPEGHVELIHKTEDFGEPQGEKISLGDDESIPLGYSATFRVAEDDIYVIVLDVMEWDEQIPDVRMHGGDAATSRHTPGSSQSDLTILEGFRHTWHECQVRLIVSRTERPVE